MYLPSLFSSRFSQGFFAASRFSSKAKVPKPLRFQDFLELLGRFELREDDFSSSPLLLFQHFMYYFCTVLVLAYPYSSFFIFSSKGKTKGKTLEDMWNLMAKLSSIKRLSIIMLTERCNSPRSWISFSSRVFSASLSCHKFKKWTAQFFPGLVQSISFLALWQMTRRKPTP